MFLLWATPLNDVMFLEGNGASSKHLKEKIIKNTLYLTGEFLTCLLSSASRRRRTSQCQWNTHKCNLGERLGRDEPPTAADKGEQFAKLHKREILGCIEVNFHHLVLIRPGSWDRPERYVPSEHFNFYKQGIFLLLTWLSSLRHILWVTFE